MATRPTIPGILKPTFACNKPPGHRTIRAETNNETCKLSSVALRCGKVGLPSTEDFI